MKSPFMHVYLILILIHCLSFASGKTAESKVSANQPQASKAKAGKRSPSNCSGPCLSADISRKKIKDLITRHNVSPNVLDGATYDKQSEIVSLTTEEVAGFLKNHKTEIENPGLSEDALNELLGVWLTAIDFDPHHAIAIVNAEALSPYFDRIHDHLTKQLRKKTRLFPKKALVNLRLALAVAEGELNGDGNALE